MDKWPTYSIPESGFYDLVSMNYSWWTSRQPEPDEIRCVACSRIFKRPDDPSKCIYTCPHCSHCWIDEEMTGGRIT
jgi:hypothetical protein